MRKIFWLFFVVILTFACNKFEYKANDYNPDPTLSIEYFFSQIDDIEPQIKLQTFDDDCNCINAKYFKDYLFLEMYVCKVSDKDLAKKKLNEHIKPLFKDLKIKRNYQTFDFFAKDELFYYVAWKNKDFVYFAKINSNHIDFLGNLVYFRR